MKCKSCGMFIEEKWKYCPNCSKKIKANKKIFIIISVVFCVFLLFGVYGIIEKNTPINESYIKKSLSNKYNEKFNDIYYIKSVENPDTDLNCDGSSFGTIKGEGSKEYYKVYSKKNNLEFFVYYDTSDENKIIYDTYDTYLNRRNIILEIYDFTKTNFNNIEFSISYNNEQPIEITSKSYLENILSHFKDKDILNNSSDTFFEDIYVIINDDIFEFSKNNYSLIKKLNNKVVNLKNKYYFSMFLLFNNDAKIELDRLDSEPYVYDKFGNNKAWGERLDDFVLRTEY